VPDADSAPRPMRPDSYRPPEKRRFVIWCISAVFDGFIEAADPGP
jgi:hypothetical protein